MSLHLLERTPPADIVRHHLSGDTHAAMSTAFGPSGVVLIDLLQRAGLDIPVYFLDTGFHFPETLALVDRWRERGASIEVIAPRLPAALAARLWESDPDRCCDLRKVQPNARALAGRDLWITALRRDQHPARAHTPIHQRITLGDGRVIHKIAPLAAWTRGRVWRHILDHDLPYNPLHDRGYPSVGCTHCTAAVGAGAGERDGRWAGRAKVECGLHLAGGTR